MDLSDLKSFAQSLKEKFTIADAASPEDQLKFPVAHLLEAAGHRYDLTVKTKTETYLYERKARPDIAVYAGGLICGYVELKAPGSGADAPKLKGDHNKKQWQKLKSLPNLIYTDGREWALYRSGARPVEQPLVRLYDDPSMKGAAAAVADDAEALERMFRDFLSWQPIVPHKPTPLAKYLAPLTRFLRSEVENALCTSGSAVNLLANEWRQHFFPNADDAQFADAYAQTVTYAMLLARLSGAPKLDPTDAAKALDKNNGLLARTLEILGQEGARDELRVGFDLLQRSLEALNPSDFLKSSPDLWLYFYEDFLAAYDPKLRKDYGVYYTPREVVELQVRLASELLETCFGKKLGFADDGVVFLDPAVGTGTYPVAAIKHGLEKVRARFGAGAVPGRARQMAENMHGFEILVGPYAVAQLRLTQTIEGAMNEGRPEGEPEKMLGKRLNIYLADTLESPSKEPPGQLTLTHRTLTQEHEAARRVKNEGDILVCLGNPPYDRQTIEEGDTTTQRKGGWVRFGDQLPGGAKQEQQGEHAIFKDFITPATAAGAGGHVKNIYNDYVYFWRWALWRLFEQQNCGGIVTFITASSYLTGPGFVGVREMMRRTFDELWIIDLGGDNLGTRKTPNVFNIQTPVAIAIGIRGERSYSETLAAVRYTKIEGATRGEKLARLDAIAEFGDVNWRDCQSDWQKPFLPVGQGDYFQWPRLSDLFPYQRSGSKFGRPWPIGETREVLLSRWTKMLSETGRKRALLFKNNQYRKIERQYKDHNTGRLLPSLESLSNDAPCPKISSYAFRSFDRHCAIEDIRVNDRMGEVLWRVKSKHQIYLTSLATEALGAGQGIIASAAVPDLHHFRGSFGGKDVIPLYRDALGTEPNVTRGLLDVLAAEYDSRTAAEDLAAYVYALLGGQSYTKCFWNELETPGPRVPITKDGATFAEAAELGRQLIWLHTYAERFRGDDRGGEVPRGQATSIRGVASDPATYPSEFGYVPDKQEITVGDGRFGPVSAEVWEFEVSGLKVVQSWLGYRMKKRKGKKSSRLDDIRPERWTPRMSDELLELLWVLEASLAMEPELRDALDQVVTGACFTGADLPHPQPRERDAPAKRSSAGKLLTEMGVDEAESGDKRE